MTPKRKAVNECCSLIDASKTKEDFFKLKKKVGEKYGLREMLKNSEIAEALPENKRKELRHLLKTRHVRSLSGVSVIAVMTKPYPCPGKCIYCPTGLGPKSYTGFEPAALRARQNNFDPARQVLARIGQLEAIGHEPEKCELIVMGGTFNALPYAYRHAFIKSCFSAFNGTKSETLELAQKRNETAKHRVIGLTLETRPDYCNEKQIAQMLSFGCTRVELGVQSLDDDVLKKVKRGHTVQATIDATQRCKDAFLKVGYHVMPGLFAGGKEDVKMFETLFTDERFKPDMLKIYPCLVLKGTPLYRMWKRGEYKPYDTTKAVQVIAECKRFVPEWCRIMRIDRDIPTNLVVDGVKNSNLRELVKKEMQEKGRECKCIRCREAGLLSRKGVEVEWDKVKLERINYGASGGEEVFLSFETPKVLLGFLRLRNPAEPFLPQIDDKTMGVRELHVYGEELPVGARKEEAVQHKSLGKQLLAEAERIASEEFDAKKIVVTSGVGVRQYYRRLGYRLQGSYMSKTL